MENRWYIIRTHVGYEKSVKAALVEERNKSQHGDASGEVLAPTEKVIEMARGKKRTVERCLFPGYIFARVGLDEETWHRIRSVPKVLGFVGGKFLPTPLSNQEMEDILRRSEIGTAVPRPKFTFEIGEPIKVVDGPFRDFTGVVEALKPERSRARVTVSVFGRQTPLELDFHQLVAA